jgi:hypothetical protein
VRPGASGSRAIVLDPGICDPRLEGDCNMDDILELQPIDLEAEPVAFGSTDAALSAKELVLTGRVQFGSPQIVPIDESYQPEDTDLQAFVKAQAGSVRFALAHMSVHFPFGKPPLVAASVEVDLADDAGTGRTLAYSIFPTNLGYAKDVTHGFKLEPNLTIAGTGGSIGGINKKTVEHGTQDYLIGGPELSPHPAWMFRRTRAQAIEGSTRLIMVIEVPVGCIGSLSVSLQASVEKRKFRFIKRHIPLSGADQANPALVTF